MVRVTVGFDENGRQLCKILGYVKNRKEGLAMLSEYHKDPNAVDNDTTFEDIYEMLLNKKEDNVTESSKRGYRAAFKAASALHKMKMKDIKLHHLQAVLDAKERSKSSKAKMKVTYGLMFDIAIQNDIVDKNYAKFLDTGKSDATKKEVYTDDEIHKLWEHQGDVYVDATLVLLYTGMRIGELLEIKMENVHLDEQYMVGGLKTEAGKNRTIALADKIMPIMRRLYGDGTARGLLVKENGFPHSYDSFSYTWKKRMKELSIAKGLHETRHTCVSRLFKAGVQKELIQKLVGHSGTDVTDKVYLHVDINQLLEAVNRLE